MILRESWQPALDVVGLDPGPTSADSAAMSATQRCSAGPVAQAGKKSAPRARRNPSTRPPLLLLPARPAEAANETESYPATESPRSSAPTSRWRSHPAALPDTPATPANRNALNFLPSAPQSAALTCASPRA